MRIKEIQALRALASLLVVIYHAKIIGGGYIGVDIFYVISGYLITGLLLREMEKAHSFSFRAFYLRRIKRLLPTSAVVLLITALISWILFPPTMRHDLGRGVIAAGTYISNFLFALWQMDYQNLNAIPPVVIHYWSLAVEEQFYLFWPFFIFILFRKGGRNFVGKGIACVTLLSFIWSLYLTTASPIWAFYSLPTRAWELGIGALLLYIRIDGRVAAISSVAALALISFGSFAFNDNTAFPGTSALIPVIATALAIASVGGWAGFLAKVSQFRVVQWLGEISYPLYLWHWPLLVIPNVYFGRGLHIYERALCVLATVALADLTHRWIEEPLRHKDFLPSYIVKLASVATAVSVISGISIYFNYSDRLVMPNGKVYSLTRVQEKPLVYNDNCHVNNGETKSGNCTYGVRGAAKKIVLFGDSHAAQWFPALERLAALHKFELISLTKSACPGPAVKKVDTGAYKNADCSAWRINSYQRIALLHPDAVIVSGMQHFELPKGITDRGNWWRDGERETLRNLRGTTPHLIYITDTPHPQRDIPSCLAAGVKARCDRTQPSRPYTIAGFKNIDPTSWLCTDTCPAIVDNIVAYRDASHISVDMSRKLSKKLFIALQQAGVGF